MATLYDLSKTYSDLLFMYDAAEDDETRDRLLESLASVGDSLTDKADAYARIIRNKDAEAKALKAEADRLTEKRKAAEAAVTRLKAAMLDDFITWRLRAARMARKFPRARRYTFN